MNVRFAHVIGWMEGGFGMSNRITVQDIADALGLSRNTVSKALNNSDGIAEETRSRVLNKAIEMGYKQFAYASGLLEQRGLEPFAPVAPGKPNEISLLTRSTWDERHFAALMLDAFEREISQLGFVLRTYHIEDKKAERLELPEAFDPSRTAAIMCIEMFDFAYDQMVCGLGFPVLFIDSPARLGDHILPADLLLMDNTTALQHIVNVLVSDGVRRVGFIGDCLHCQSFAERYATVAYVMNLADLAFDRRYYLGYNDQEDIAAGLGSMTERDDLPELFVCANDFVAIGALQALRALGKRVPDDVMLVGFDDAPESRTCVPPLTTVHIHTQVMAYSAAQLIMTRLKEPSLDFRQVHTQTDLIVRASTARR